MRRWTKPRNSIAELAAEFEGREKAIATALEDLKYEMVRALILHEKKRLDGAR
jgi:polyribonucleotide nucleotidyltransferase